MYIAYILVKSYHYFQCLGIVQLLLEVFGKMVESDEAAVSLTCVLLMIVDNDFDKYINDFIYGLQMKSG